MRWVGLIVAVGVAAIAAFLVLTLSGDEEKPVVRKSTRPDRPVVAQQKPPEVKTVSVYVAARDIPIGTRLEENMIDTQPWPAHLVVDNFIVGPEAGTNLVGKITRASFKSREPLINSKIINPDDPNFLAGELEKGNRLVTIRIDEIAGVAGFVFPGDRVDILVTHEILREDVTQEDLEDEGNRRNLEENVTEVLVPNVKVLAVDQRSSTTNEEGIIVPRSASVEVTPEDAQRIRLAAEIGELSLALRSIDDKDTIETVAITREDDLTQYDTSNLQTADARPGTPRGGVRIVRGTTVEEPEDN